MLLTKGRVVRDDAKAKALEQSAQPFPDHAHPDKAYRFAVDARPVERFGLAVVMSFVIIPHRTEVASARKKDLRQCHLRHRHGVHVPSTDKHDAVVDYGLSEGPHVAGGVEDRFKLGHLPKLLVRQVGHSPGSEDNLYVGQVGGLLVKVFCVDDLRIEVGKLLDRLPSTLAKDLTVLDRIVIKQRCSLRHRSPL